MSSTPPCVGIRPAPQVSTDERSGNFLVDFRSCRPPRLPLLLGDVEGRAIAIRAASAGEVRRAATFSEGGRRRGETASLRRRISVFAARGYRARSMARCRAGAPPGCAGRRVRSRLTHDQLRRTCSSTCPRREDLVGGAALERFRVLLSSSANISARASRKSTSAFFRAVELAAGLDGLRNSFCPDGGRGRRCAPPGKTLEAMREERTYRSGSRQALADRPRCRRSAFRRFCSDVFAASGSFFAGSAEA